MQSGLSQDTLSFPYQGPSRPSSRSSNMQTCCAAFFPSLKSTTLIYEEGHMMVGIDLQHRQFREGGSVADALTCMHAKECPLLVAQEGIKTLSLTFLLPRHYMCFWSCLVTWPMQGHAWSLATVLGGQATSRRRTASGHGANHA